jgi:hypothetical protein
MVMGRSRFISLAAAVLAMVGVCGTGRASVLHVHVMQGGKPAVGAMVRLRTHGGRHLQSRRVNGGGHASFDMEEGAFTVRAEEGGRRGMSAGIMGKGVSSNMTISLSAPRPGWRWGWHHGRPHLGTRFMHRRALARDLIHKAVVAHRAARPAAVTGKKVR